MEILRLTKQDLIQILQAGNKAFQPIIDVKTDGEFVNIFFKHETKTNGIRGVDNDIMFFLLEIKEILLRMEQKGIRVL